jgi:hypothetical protein
MAQHSHSIRRRLILIAALVAVIVAGRLVLKAMKPPAQTPPALTFIRYTNNGGQSEALFRLEHPPCPILADGLHELRYQTSTGWVRPSAPSVSLRFFGWDKTGSVAAISLETTNLPARVVMDFWTRRKGIPGLYDQLLDRWEKLKGETPMLRGDVVYVTNQTDATALNP